MKSNKKILLTGGAGFIGKALLQKIVKKYHITVIDNFFRFGEKEFKKTNINFKKIKLIKSNINNENIIRKIIKNNDLIIHFAAISQVVPSIENPDLCFEWNTIGTKNIIKYCTLYNKKLIFASSREVYGTAEYIPVDLNHKINPKNPYAASKTAGEALINAYATTYNLKNIIVRFSNVYGYGDINRVVPIFINKAINDENIEIFGNDKLIDFVYIDDVIDALVKIINNNKINNEIFNIGSGKGISLEKLAKIIVKVTKSRSKIIKKKARIGEIDKFVADISKTKKILNWKPKFSLEKGISNIIKLYYEI